MTHDHPSLTMTQSLLGACIACITITLGSFISSTGVAALQALLSGHTDLSSIIVPLRVDIPDSWLTPLYVHSALVLGLSLAPRTLPFRTAFLHHLRVLGQHVHARVVFGTAAVGLLVLSATRWYMSTPGHDRTMLLFALGLLQAHAYHLMWANEAGETTALVALEEDIARRELQAWTPPPREKYSVAPLLLQAALQPKFLGAELLPKATRKILFVMNHQMGGLEIPCFVEYCHVHHDLFPRSLADHMHFYIPAWGQALRQYGAIDGTRENCALVMERGQPVLVFPGGGNEILKSKEDAKYQLKWKERAGFARIAMEHGYTIVPVAAAGLEDQLDVLADIPVGKMLAGMGAAKGSRAELSVPIVLPNARELGQRLYFRFLEPLDTLAYGGKDKAGDKEAVRAVRDLVKERLQVGIRALLKERELDPERFLVGTRRSTRR